MRDLLRHHRHRVAATAGVGAVAAVVLGGWWARNGERRPYGPRWLAEVLPRPRLSRARLLAVLEPASGERVLEVGPGYGYYSLAVAQRLGSNGELCLVDVRDVLLDETVGRARRAGLGNVVAHRADAIALPFSDDEFSAAYLVACLGEIDDGARAVRELARVGPWGTTERKVPVGPTNSGHGHSRRTPPFDRRAPAGRAADQLRIPHRPRLSAGA